MYAHFCRALPEGQADADAYLAGDEMPSVIARREEKAAGIERLAELSRTQAAG